MLLDVQEPYLYIGSEGPKHQFINKISKRVTRVLTSNAVNIRNGSSRVVVPGDKLGGILCNAVGMTIIFGGIVNNSILVEVREPIDYSLHSSYTVKLI